MTEPSDRGNDAAQDELIQAYLDREATPEAEAEFRRRLAEPAFRRRLAEYAIDSGQLYELSQEGFLATSPAARLPAATVASPSRPRWSYGAAALVAAFLSAAVVAFWIAGNGGDMDDVCTEHAAIGRLVRIEGQVTFEAHGQPRAAEEGSRVREGEILHTQGLSSFALLLLEDGTELGLAGETKVACTKQGDQERVTVYEGQLSARVAPQPPSSPLVIHTPSAEIVVLGTSLTISADAQSSELGVHEGRVRMKRFSDGQAIEVAGGEYAVASPHAELVARPLPAAPECWSEDFESGLPENWRYGQWVGEGLPAGSRGGVRAACQSALDGGLIHDYRITLPKAWTQGLFRVEDDSLLSFTYKMDRPGWFQIMMGIRSDNPVPAHVGNYELQDSRWSKMAPGQWRTVHIPLRAFRKNVKGVAYSHLPDHPPRASDLVYLLWFSTGQEDRGLVIDRIWISRGEKPE